MAIFRIKDPGIWSGLGRGAAGLMDEIAEKKSLDELRESIGDTYDIPSDLAKNLDRKTLQSIASDQISQVPKAQAKEQKELSNIAQAYQSLTNLEELYDKTSYGDAWLKKKSQSPEYRRMEREARKLRANPYLKSKGIDIPDAGQRGFKEGIKEARAEFEQEYADRIPQRQPMQPQQPQIPGQQPTQQQLPQQLVQPRSVQQEMPQQTPGQEPTGPLPQRGLLQGGAQVAAEVARSANPLGFTSDIGKAIEDFREGKIADDETMEKAFERMPEPIRSQAKKAFEELKKEREFKVSDYLPTAKNREKIVDSVTDKVFGPTDNKNKSDLEKYITNLASAVGTRQFFKGKSILSAKDLAKNAATVLGSEAAGAAAEEAGLGKAGRFIVSTGVSMFADPLLRSLEEKIKNNARPIYNKLDEALKDKVGPARKINEISSNAVQKLPAYKGLPSELSDYAKDIKNQSDLGIMELGTVREYTKGMNNWYYEGGKYDLNDTGEAIFNSLKGALEQTLEEGMKKNGMGALHKEYLFAKDITKGLNNAKFGISNLWRVISSGKSSARSIWGLLKESGPEAVTLGSAGYLAGGSPLAAVAGGAGLGLNTMRAAYKFLQTPTAKKEFLKMVPALLTNNVPIIEKQTGIISDLYDKSQRKKRK